MYIVQIVEGVGKPLFASVYDVILYMLQVLELVFFFLFCNMFLE
jgi:hypothetical protein